MKAVEVTIHPEAETLIRMITIIQESIIALDQPRLAKLPGNKELVAKFNKRLEKLQQKLIQTNNKENEMNYESYYYPISACEVPAVKKGLKLIENSTYFTKQQKQLLPFSKLQEQGYGLGLRNDILVIYIINGILNMMPVTNEIKEVKKELKAWGKF